VPAMGAILEQLPEDARGAVFLEVPDASDALDLAAPAGVEVRWLARGTAADAYGARLVEAVTEWADAWVATDPAATAVPAAPVTTRELPALGDEELVWEVPEPADDGGLYAWLAGEASAITTLRRHLVKQLGVDRRRVAFMGYWKLGRAEG
jgi:NADPH-dependent ferric siderophore reductase